MSVNQVTLIGNVGKDPDLRNLHNGDTVASLSVATSQRKKQNDEWVDETQWHRVVCFKRLAELVSEKVSKGTTIYVNGRIQYRSYEKDGVKQNVTEIVANDLQVLSAKTVKKSSDEEEIPF